MLGEPIPIRLRFYKFKEKKNCTHYGLVKAVPPNDKDNPLHKFRFICIFEVQGCPFRSVDIDAANISHARLWLQALLKQPGWLLPPLT